MWFNCDIKVTLSLENECELKRFKACVVYQRVRPFWIYITVSLFIKLYSLSTCVLKIFSILKTKKKEKKRVTLSYPKKPLGWGDERITIYP